MKAWERNGFILVIYGMWFWAGEQSKGHPLNAVFAVRILDGRKYLQMVANRTVFIIPVYFPAQAIYYTDETLKPQSSHQQFDPEYLYAEKNIINSVILFK